MSNEQHPILELVRRLVRAEAGRDLDAYVEPLVFSLAGPQAPRGRTEEHP